MTSPGPQRLRPIKGSNGANAGLLPKRSPRTDGWGPTHDASDMPDGASVWEGPQAPADRSSGWSSAAADRPPPASPGDIWGQITEDNVVDWARGGFGSPVEPPPADPLGLEEPSAINATPLRSPAEMMEASAPASASAPAPPQPRRRTRPPAKAAGPAPARAAAPEPAPAEADAEQLIAAFLSAAGVSAGDLKGPPDQAVARAGGLLRRLVAGLVVLVEARARAKSQMGAETTRLELEGNNPIKFARSPEQALAQLLSSAERGFMNSDRAVEDAFYDLQSHQMATLKAMQGALRATLDRFSPQSIRNRAETQGFLASILPAARDAALWRAYEREFSGVALGSDEAFMDVFAKEFRKAYEEQSRRASPAALIFNLEPQHVRLPALLLRGGRETLLPCDITSAECRPNNVSRKWPLAGEENQPGPSVVVHVHFELVSIIALFRCPEGLHCSVQILPTIQQLRNHPRRLDTK